MNIPLDKLKKEIKIGDTIVCVGGQGELQQMKVTDFRSRGRGAFFELHCLPLESCSSTPKKKWKSAHDCIVINDLLNQSQTKTSEETNV